jgi:hypothetical protein
MLKILTMATDFLLKYAKAVTPVQMISQVAMLIVLISWTGIVVLISPNFPLIASMWDRYSNKYEVRVEDALLVTNQLNTLLAEQQIRLDVDRIYVSKFHNGKVDLSGIHFIYFSRVSEATGPGVSNEIARAQSLPLSIFPDMLTSLAKNECYYIDRIDENISGQRFLENMGINSMMICPVVSVDNRLVGIIGVDGVLSSLNTTDVVSLEATLKTLAGVIGSLFSPE